MRAQLPFELERNAVEWRGTAEWAADRLGSKKRTDVGSKEEDVAYGLATGKVKRRARGVQRGSTGHFCGCVSSDVA